MIQKVINVVEGDRSAKIVGVHFTDILMLFNRGGNPIPITLLSQCKSLGTATPAI